MADAHPTDQTQDPISTQESALVHLHNHSEYSSLDGGSQVAHMVAKLESLGMKGMALTDHGVMQGLPTFYNTLKKAGMKPILGMEAYLTNDRHDKSKGTPTWHLTLLAATTEGYHNLCQLSSRAFIDGTIITFGRARARADWELLAEHAPGVIALTGCMASPVMHAIFEGDLAAAKDYTERLVATYGAENVYGEIQNVGITVGIPGDSEIARLLGKEPLSAAEASRYEEVEAGQVPLSQTEANGVLVDHICKPLGLKYVGTGDTHYLNEEDANPHDVMICIGTGQTKKGPRRFSLLPRKYHMRPAEEMAKALAAWPEAIATTKELALRCNAEIEYNRELLPAYPIPEGFADSAAYLRHLCFAGLEERYEQGTPRRDEAVERLEMELGVITSMGFNDYFLITWDLFNEANRRDIPSGPGRGCLTGDVPIWTTRGYVPLAEVQPGDVVATHNGNLTSVKRRWEYEVDETIVTLGSYRGFQPVSLTADHKILVCETAEADAAWMRAEDVVPGMYVRTPRIDWGEETAPTVIDLAEFAHSNSSTASFEITDDSIIEVRRATRQAKHTSLRTLARRHHVSRVSLGRAVHGTASPGETASALMVAQAEGHQTVVKWAAAATETRFERLEFPRYIQVDEEFLRLYGLMASDGFVTKRDAAVAWCERRSVNTGEVLGLIGRVWPGAAPMRVSHPTSDVDTHVLRSHLLKNLYLALLPNYDFTADTKALADWTLLLDSQRKQWLLDGLWSGDGHVGKTTGYTTSSPKLLWQVRSLLHDVDAPSTVYLDDRSTSNDTGYRNAKPVYRLFTSRDRAGFSHRKQGFLGDDGHLYCAIRSATRERRRTTVYDLAVDHPDVSYLTGSFAVHNSAAGSIVAYTLDITKLCPLEYGLLFERFLNPGRRSMPDIDCDFAESFNGGRKALMAYAAEKYNAIAGCETAVAQIVTFQRYKAKNALKDSARVLAEPDAPGQDFNKKEALKLGDRLSALVPAFPGITMGSLWDGQHKREGEPLRAAAKKGGLAAEVITQAGWLEGMIKTYGLHAAAVIIASHDLTKDLPLQKFGSGPDKPLHTQYDMDISADLGLLKMDFLGLKTLDIIWDACRKVEAVHGIKLRPWHDIPLDDAKTYEAFARGETVGLFQFESSGMRASLQEVRPTEFNDLVALVALYRPGAMTHIPTYAARKNGRQEVRFADKRLEDILSETFGVCVSGDAIIVDVESGRRHRLEDLRGREGMLVQGVDDALRPATGRVTHFIDSGVKNVFRVRLANGAAVKVTADHQLLTEIGWQPLAELQKGDYIAAPKQMLGPPLSAEPVDPRRLRVLAYLLADGALSGAATAFANQEPALLDAYVEALGAFPDVKPAYTEQVRGVMRIGAGRQLDNERAYHQPSSLLSWMRELGMKWKRQHGSGRGGLVSAEKFVPPFVFELGEADIARFLAALWDCDGYVSARTWHYKTISSQLASDVQALLLRLGVCATTHEAPYINPSGMACIAYAVTVHDTCRLAQLLQPHMAHPRKRVTAATAVSRGSTIDVTPYADELRALGRPLRAIERETGVFVLNHTRQSRHARIRQRSVQKAVSVLELPQTARLLNSNWQKIVAIEAVGAEHVYDITVEGIHSFIADGVVVHNCVYQEQSMLTARAVAGFSQAEADDLRKAIGKKLRDKMDALKPKYLKGVVENGGTKELGETLWADNEAAADYSFNKCAYAGTIVRTADGRRIKLSAAYREQPQELMAMWPDGRIAPHAVKRIVSTGRKPLYEVRTAGGRQIKVTAEHRLLTTDGYMQVQEMQVGTELMTAPVFTEAECGRRSARMHKLAHGPARAALDAHAATRMRDWQAGRSAEEKVAHMQRVHAMHPDMTDHGVVAMHARLAWLRANDSEWVRRHTEASLASVRATYDTGPGFGHCSIASNGMWCASSHERAMCEHLLEQSIDFEMHKVLPNGRICDFYFAGIYWEMDGMDREDAFFADKYDELPYVVVTPEDYQLKVARELALEHAENGDPIVSIEYWGEGPTYDVEMCEGGPKNFLANNIVSHNSHAACYAYISYITGWLKVNYPYEYMAALLTVAMGDKDKPRIFLTEAKHMGIRVLPPDINRSFNDFAVIEREEEPGSYDILFGLTAIRGVGEGVVREMRDERERHGFFTSIYDLIRRMPTLNKTVLHALVKGGALDGTGNTRKAMFDVVEEAQKLIKKEHDAEERAFVNAVKARVEAAANAEAAEATATAGGFGQQESLLTGIDAAFSAAVGPGRGTTRGPKSTVIKLTMEEKRGLEGACKAVWAAGLNLVESEVAEATEDALKKEALRLARKDAKETLKDDKDADISGIAQEEQTDSSLKDRAEEIAQAALAKQGLNIKGQAVEFCKRFLPHIRAEVSEREEASALDAALAAEADPALPTEEWERIELLNVERKMLGIYVTGHPLDEDAEQWRAYINEGTERGRELGQVSDADIGETIIVVGAVVDKAGIRMRNGEIMYRVALEDLSGMREVTIFPRTLEGGLEELLTDGQVICMQVGVQEDTFQQQRHDETAMEEGEVIGADDEETAERPVKLIASRIYRWQASKITPEFVAKAKARAAERAAQEGNGANETTDSNGSGTNGNSPAPAGEDEANGSGNGAADGNGNGNGNGPKPVRVAITASQFNPTWVARLEAVCAEHPGTHPVKLVLDGKSYITKFAVAPSAELAGGIRTLLHSGSPSEAVPAA